MTDHGAFHLGDARRNIGHFEEEGQRARIVTEQDDTLFRREVPEPLGDFCEMRGAQFDPSIPLGLLGIAPKQFQADQGGCHSHEDAVADRFRPEAAKAKLSGRGGPGLQTQSAFPADQTLLPEFMVSHDRVKATGERRSQFTQAQLGAFDRCRVRHPRARGVAGVVAVADHPMARLDRQGRGGGRIQAAGE